MTCENSNMWWKCVIVRLTELINHSLTLCVCVCRKKPWVTGPVRWWTERKRTYRNCRSASWSISPCRSTSAYKTWKQHRLLIIGPVLVLLSHKGFSLKRCSMCLKQNCRLCPNYPLILSFGWLFWHSLSSALFLLWLKLLKLTGGHLSI